MKHTMIKTISLFLILIFAAATFSACSVDPNVKQEETQSEDYQVKIDGEEVVILDQKEILGIFE